MGGQDFAVVIGIRDYTHLTALDGALEDAKRIRDWLLAFGEVPPNQLHFVTSDGAPAGEPAIATIEDAFDKVLAGARIDGARRLYVYFAGHGLSEALSQLSLLAADAKVENLGRAIDSWGYQEALANLPLFPEQIFWYDCCRYYDRQVSGRSPTWSRTSPQPPSNLRQMVHYGAGFNDAANERPLFGVTRGLFTTALLEGLEGAAARVVNGDGVVVAGDLGRYVTLRVDQLARDASLSQIPEPRYIGDPDSFLIAEHVAPAYQRIEVAVGSAPGELCVKDELNRVVDRATIQDGVDVVLLNLTPGLYVIERTPRTPECRGRIVNVAPSAIPIRVELGTV